MTCVLHGSRANVSHRRWVVDSATLSRMRVVVWSVFLVHEGHGYFGTLVRLSCECGNIDVLLEYCQGTWRRSGTHRETSRTIEFEQNCFKIFVQSRERLRWWRKHSPLMWERFVEVPVHPPELVRAKPLLDAGPAADESDIWHNTNFTRCCGDVIGCCWCEWDKASS